MNEAKKWQGIQNKKYRVGELIVYLRTYDHGIDAFIRKRDLGGYTIENTDVGQMLLLQLVSHIIVRFDCGDLELFVSLGQQFCKFPSPGGQIEHLSTSNTLDVQRLQKFVDDLGRIGRAVLVVGLTLLETCEGLGCQ